MCHSSPTYCCQTKVLNSYVTLPILISGISTTSMVAVVIISKGPYLMDPHIRTPIFVVLQYFISYHRWCFYLSTWKWLCQLQILLEIKESQLGCINCTACCIHSLNIYSPILSNPGWPILTLQHPFVRYNMCVLIKENYKNPNEDSWLLVCPFFTFAPTTLTCLKRAMDYTQPPFQITSRSHLITFLSTLLPPLPSIVWYTFSWHDALLYLLMLQLYNITISSYHYHTLTTSIPVTL